MKSNSHEASDVPRAKPPRRARNRRAGSAVADPDARESLRRADPILRELIDARPDFHPRAWLSELPPLDCFGTLTFQVVGQQLSVGATRAIVSRLRDWFDGHLPSPPELVAADPHELRATGMSARKAATLRTLADRFTAVYAGDSNYLGSSSGAVTQNITSGALTVARQTSKVTSRGALNVKVTCGGSACKAR